MPIAGDTEDDAVEEFASETSDKVVVQIQDFADWERDEVKALLRRFTSFEPNRPIDPGYERIIVKKREEWVPESGRSVKMGNLRFNLGTLFEAVASGVAAGSAAATSPIVAIFTGLVAIRNMVRASSVQLSEIDALVIWSVWWCEQQGISATSEAIHERALEEAARVGSTLQPSIEETEKSLNRLKDLEAIRLTDDNRWETREAVIVKT